MNEFVNNDLHVKVIDYNEDVGIGGALARALFYYAASFPESTKGINAKKLGEDILDALWKNYRDEKGFSSSEPRADYIKFGAEVYIPPGFNGKNGQVCYHFFSSIYRDKIKYN
jgi:hypothetical protein